MVMDFDFDLLDLLLIGCVVLALIVMMRAF